MPYLHKFSSFTKKNIIYPKKKKKKEHKAKAKALLFTQVQVSWNKWSPQWVKGSILQKKKGYKLSKLYSSTSMKIKMQNSKAFTIRLLQLEATKQGKIYNHNYTL